MVLKSCTWETVLNSIRGDCCCYFAIIIFKYIIYNIIFVALFTSVWNSKHLAWPGTGRPHKTQKDWTWNNVKSLFLANKIILQQNIWINFLQLDVPLPWNTLCICHHSGIWTVEIVSIGHYWLIVVLILVSLREMGPLDLSTVKQFLAYVDKLGHNVTAGCDLIRLKRRFSFQLILCGQYPMLIGNA